MASDYVKLPVTATESTAEEIEFDNTESGLTATDMQAAIDELAAMPSGGSEDSTLVTTFNGSVGDKTIQIRKVGKVVTIQVPQFSGTLGAPAMVGSVDGIPADLRPSEDTYAAYLLYDDASTADHISTAAVIAATGQIQLYKGALTSIGADDYYVNSFSMTWTLP
jgi:hypothetical protein